MSGQKRLRQLQLFMKGVSAFKEGAQQTPHEGSSPKQVGVCRGLSRSNSRGNLASGSEMPNGRSPSVGRFAFMAGKHDTVAHPESQHVEELDGAMLQEGTGSFELRTDCSKVGAGASLHQPHTTTHKINRCNYRSHPITGHAVAGSFAAQPRRSSRGFSSHRSPPDVLHRWLGRARARLLTRDAFLARATSATVGRRAVVCGRWGRRHAQRIGGDAKLRHASSHDGTEM